MGIATNAHKSWSEQYHTKLIAARVVSLLSLLLAILIAAYSARNFYRRDKMLTRKSDGPFDDLIGERPSKSIATDDCPSSPLQPLLSLLV